MEKLQKLEKIANLLKSANHVAVRVAWRRGEPFLPRTPRREKLSSKTTLMCKPLFSKL
jgi:hypothetical protein